MASNSERREFEKYLKFLVNKVGNLDQQSLADRGIVLKSSYPDNIGCSSGCTVKARSKVNVQIYPIWKRMGNGYNNLKISIRFFLFYFLYQFNVTVPDEKRVSSELKRSLEGRLPQPEQPVTLEIQMETLEVSNGYECVHV